MAAAFGSIYDDKSDTFEANAGAQLVLSGFTISEKPDLVNYLRAGWGVSVFGAIDFTASNGDPALVETFNLSFSLL